MLPEATLGRKPSRNGGNRAPSPGPLHPPEPRGTTSKRRDLEVCSRTARSRMRRCASGLGCHAGERERSAIRHRADAAMEARA
ncbi:Hypothetical protein A7982_05101 [Minicystis rosea]|nr:Hypothetical protein A7982_05101 [Minicystis rosea]